MNELVDDHVLFRANGDIAFISQTLKSIGWLSFNELSLQRIIYLSKVLYSFVYEDSNIFNYYHFSTTSFGPRASLIDNSVIFLASAEYLESDKDGRIKISHRMPEFLITEQKKTWIKTIIFILGKYGEERIFGFIINDPIYNDAVLTNKQKSIGEDSPENKTVEILNNFKAIFEETLGNDANSISKEEYLDLYFEYIFGKIITK